MEKSPFSDGRAKGREGREAKIASGKGTAQLTVGCLVHWEQGEAGLERLVSQVAKRARRRILLTRFSTPL